jgi:hypothetical protein
VATSKRKDVNVRFRFSDGRNVQLYHKSEFLISPDDWDAKRECVKAKIVYNAKKRKSFDEGINRRKDLIREICAEENDKSELTSEWLETAIDKELHPEKYEKIEIRKTFFEIFDDFLSVKSFSDWRVRA